MTDTPIAIVTGGESGIGAACVSALVGAGARVAFTYFKDAAAAAAVQRDAGGPAVALPIQCDVGDEAAVAALFTATEQAFGTATWLVNSAGLNMTGVRIVDMPLAQFDRVVRCASCGRRRLDERPVEREHPRDVRARVVVELVTAQVEVRQARARAERL